MDELRALALYADGEHIAEGSRMRLKGRATMCLRPDLWELHVYEMPGEALAAARNSRYVSVEGQDGSVLACGQVEEVYTHEDDGKAISTILISDGMDFWTSTVSITLAGRNTILDAIRTLASRCSNPVPIAHINAKDADMFRGQTFHGRTAGFISDLAKSLEARAYYVRGSLQIVTMGADSNEISLMDEDLTGSVSEANGACIVRLSAMKGYPIGHIVKLPDRVMKYRLLCQSVEADNYQGAWRTELVLMDESRIESGDDWGGG